MSFRMYVCTSCGVEALEVLVDAVLDVAPDDLGDALVVAVTRQIWP